MGIRIPNPKNLHTRCRRLCFSWKTIFVASEKEKKTALSSNFLLDDKGLDKDGNFYQQANWKASQEVMKRLDLG